MSSKFSVRPAPRKRPWICKAGPPALPMPPYPLQLLASVSLKYIGPLPPSDRWACTFVLKPLSSIGPYRGDFITPTDRINLTFYWAQGDPQGYADALFRVGPYFTPGTWETKTVTPNPYLRYESHILVPANPGNWSTVLIITA
jgi:hypothetical protein